MSRFDSYLDSVNGVAIDVDGNHGPQCWDLWSHYGMNMFGLSMWATSTNSGGTYHHPGYACEIWHNFNTSPLRDSFTAIPANQPAQRGDVVLWEWGSPVGPNSHVAIVVEDRGGSLYCMTQNPGASHYADLSKSGVLGYLRPNDQSIFDNGETPNRKKKRMQGAFYRTPDGGILWQEKPNTGFHPINLTTWLAYEANGNRYADLSKSDVDVLVSRYGIIS